MAQAHYRKIKEIFDKTADNEGNIEKLEKVKIIPNSINYVKNQREYVIDWMLMNYTDFYVTDIELKNFPEEFISNLKVVGIFKTTDGLLNSTGYLNFTPNYFYAIREQINKYTLNLWVEQPLINDVFFKLIISATNPGDFYEIRTRKE